MRIANWQSWTAALALAAFGALWSAPLAADETKAKRAAIK